MFFIHLLSTQPAFSSGRVTPLFISGNFILSFLVNITTIQQVAHAGNLGISHPRPLLHYLPHLVLLLPPSKCVSNESSCFIVSPSSESPHLSLDYHNSLLTYPGSPPPPAIFAAPTARLILPNLRSDCYHSPT